MKKKTYQQPQVELFEVKTAEIICTSQGYNEGPVKINNGEDLLLDEEDW